MLLQQMLTKLLVSCMINPAVPRLTIFFTTVTEAANSFHFNRRTLYSAFLCKKKSTNAADRNWERIVAVAAPLIPMPNRKIKTGSRSRFATAPMATDNIPMVEYPWALIKEFMPVDIIDGSVPNR